MRRLRARRRQAGLVERRTWVSADAPEPWSDHRISEIRSLALHALIARKLVRDPAVVATAVANLDRWSAQRGEERPRWVDEWRDILRRPASEVAAFLVSTSPDAFRLRQSTPFAGVLSPEERTAVFTAFRERR
jgi:hypothetical protein